MLIITWIYERFNTEHDFFKDTVQGREFQTTVDTLRENSGLVLSHTNRTSSDELTFTSIYIYENKEACDQFTKLIIETAPTYFPTRNLYLLECNHRLSGTSTEPIFRPANVDFLTYDGNDLTSTTSFGLLS